MWSGDVEAVHVCVGMKDWGGDSLFDSISLSLSPHIALLLAGEQWG